MTRLFIIAICLLSAASLHAADVVIREDGTITKDGVLLNNAWDALLNKQVTNAEFAAAWKVRNEAIAAKLAEAQKAIAQRDEILTATLAKNTAAIEKAVRTEKQRRKDEAQSKIDAAKKELEEASK